MEKFIETGTSVVHKEHKQMPKTCEKCGDKMDFVWQALVCDSTPGDIIMYRCKNCHYGVKKFFPFPEEYAQFWNQSSARKVKT